MHEASRQCLTLILQTDRSLTPEVRRLLSDLAAGKPIQGVTLDGAVENQQLVDVKDAARRLGVSRSKIYIERDRYPELTPINFGGRVSYSVTQIDQLILRLGRDALRQRQHNKELSYAARG
jgi:hypothetical protein